MGEINIGDRVKDKVTNFVGIVTGRAIYMNGCVRCRVEAPVKKDGALIEGEWIDEGQLVFVKSVFTETGENVTGGPTNDPGSIDP